MEPSPRLETIDYVHQLGDHLEAALFAARRVDDDPEAAVVLVKSALAYGEVARAAPWSRAWREGRRRTPGPRAWPAPPPPAGNSWTAARSRRPGARRRW